MDRESQLSRRTRRTTRGGGGEDDEEDEEEEERRTRQEEAEEEKEKEEEATDIKSNNPHLAGGEKQSPTPLTKMWESTSQSQARGWTDQL